MSIAARVICGAIASAALSLAAPVATVSSTSPFSLDGTSMTLTAVMSWPVVLGDEITTGSSSGYVLFKDGSQLTVSPKSTLRISGTETSPVVVLEVGALDYKIAKGSRVSLVRQQDGPQMAYNAGTTQPTRQLGSQSSSRLPVVAATSALASGASGVGALFATGRLSSGVSAVTTASASSSSTTDFTAHKIQISVYK